MPCLHVAIWRGTEYNVNCGCFVHTHALVMAYSQKMYGENKTLRTCCYDRDEYPDDSGRAVQ
jgi:hypothetical protein